MPTKKITKKIIALVNEIVKVYGKDNVMNVINAVDETTSNESSPKDKKKRTLTDEQKSRMQEARKAKRKTKEEAKIDNNTDENVPAFEPSTQ